METGQDRSAEAVGMTGISGVFPGGDTLEGFGERSVDEERSADSLLPAITVDWLLFWLLWPFGALTGALRRFRAPYAKTVLVLFCLYFGFVFLYGDPYADKTTDSARYAATLIEMNHHPVPFERLVTLFYHPKSGMIDLYQPLMTWGVSLFTSDPRVLFALFAAIFGIFWAQNLWLVYSRTPAGGGVLLLLFMLGLALINPVWYINGVRMWTAAQIYVYGALLWFLEEKRSGLLWILLSVLVHFSFIFPVVLFLGYLVLPGSLSLMFLFFVATSFVREINLTAVREALDYLPDIFRDRMEGYTSENYARSVSETAQQLPLYVQMSEKVGNIIVYAWAIGVYFTRKVWAPPSPALVRLFGYALFLGGCAQIVSLIPSGLRFVVVAYSLFYAAFILVMAHMPVKGSVAMLRTASVPLLLYLAICNLRMGFDFMGMNTFLGNPVLAFFSEEQIPLIEYIKQLF